MVGQVLVVAFLGVSLTACQGATSLPNSSNSSNLRRGSQAVASSRSSLLASGDCTYNYYILFRKRGGKVGLPSLPSGDFGGQVFYAATTGNAPARLSVCPGTDNQYNIPVPSGYTPDWFGTLNVAGPIFKQGNDFGEMTSTTWLPKTNYYLYLYDGDDNFVKSYEIGPLAAKKSKLKFASPFENFTVPDSGLNLEIVHPVSQSRTR